MIPRRRWGITKVAIVITVVVVLVVAGVGVFVLVFPGSGSSTYKTTISLNPTLSSSSSGSSQGSQNYNGTFSYTEPVGPSGVGDAGGQVMEWNSSQSASGSFTFAIDPATYTGTGSGQGTITVVTSGYCTGNTTVHYTFTIQAAWPPGENMTIAFNLPTPASVTVNLTCEGSTKGFSPANNPVSFLSVYPNGLSLGSFPTTESQPPTNGIGYTVSITRAG